MKRDETVLTRADVTPDGVAIYEHSHIDRKTGEVTRVWHPVVNLSTGLIDCDCPHFNCRLFPRARTDRRRPDIGTPRYQCKHLQAAIRDCIEIGDIILTLKGINKT